MTVHRDFSRESTSLGARRRGLTSIVILVGLVIIAIVSAGLIKVGRARRAAVEGEERRLQAGWLAESGLARGRAGLSRSKDYAGETWEVSADELGGRGPASVRIEVEAVADRPDRRKVRARADYPAGSPLRARQSRETTITIRSASPTS